MKKFHVMLFLLLSLMLVGSGLFAAPTGDTRYPVTEFSQD